MMSLHALEDFNMESDENAYRTLLGGGCRRR